ARRTRAGIESRHRHKDLPRRHAHFADRQRYLLGALFRARLPCRQSRDGVRPVTDPDLSFLTRQVERLITEVASMRDEVRVQGAMIMRLDAMAVRSEGTQSQSLEQMRAIQ